jgi:hypothetical protein
METWPSTLPGLSVNTTITDDESRLISPMDAGPSTVRNRFTAITQTVKSGMIVTGAQLAIFNTFLRTTLSQGASSFNWVHPATGAPCVMRFKKKPEWSCVKASVVPDNRLWQGSMELEILP